MISVDISTISVPCNHILSCTGNMYIWCICYVYIADVCVHVYGHERDSRWIGHLGLRAQPKATECLFVLSNCLDNVAYDSPTSLALSSPPVKITKSVITSFRGGVNSTL